MGLLKPAWLNGDRYKGLKALEKIVDQKKLLKIYFRYWDEWKRHKGKASYISLQYEVFRMLDLEKLDKDTLAEIKSKVISDNRICERIDRLLGVPAPTIADLSQSIAQRDRKAAVDSHQLSQRQLADMVLKFDDYDALMEITDQSLLKEIMYSLPYHDFMLNKTNPKKYALYRYILAVKASDDLLLDFAQNTPKLASNAIYHMKSQSHLEIAAQDKGIRASERYQAIKKLSDKELAQSLIDNDEELLRKQKHDRDMAARSDYGFLADHKD